MTFNKTLSMIGSFGFGCLLLLAPTKELSAADSATRIAKDRLDISGSAQQYRDCSAAIPTSVLAYHLELAPTQPNIGTLSQTHAAARARVLKRPASGKQEQN